MNLFILFNFSQKKETSENKKKRLFFKIKNKNMFEIYIQFLNYVNSKIETGIMIENEGVELGEIRHKLCEYLNIQHEPNLILLDSLGLTVLDDDHMTLSTFLNKGQIVIYYEHSSSGDDDHSRNHISGHEETVHQRCDSKFIESESKNVDPFNGLSDNEVINLFKAKTGYGNEDKRYQPFDDAIEVMLRTRYDDGDTAHSYSDKNKEGEKAIKAIEFSVALNRLVDRNLRTRFPSMERLGLIIVKAFGSDKKV